MHRNSFIVTGVHQERDGSPLAEALSTTFADGSDIAVERVTDFDPAEGVAMVGDEVFFFDDIDELRDKLVGCSRPTPANHAIGTFVQMGDEDRVEYVALGYFEDENHKAAVKIREDVAPRWPLGAYVEAEYRECEVESDDEGHSEVVTAPLNEKWTIENVAPGQGGTAYGRPHRFRLDERGFFVWDANNNPLIALDAEALSHLLVGTFKNALSGTRWELLSSVVNELRAVVADNAFPGVLVVGTGSLEMVVPGNVAARPALQLLSDDRIRVRSNELELGPSYQARGYVSAQWSANMIDAANRTPGVPAQYQGVTKTANVPTGITLTTLNSSNVTDITASQITNRGFRMNVKSAAAGFMAASVDFVTVGA